jgi:3-isopropylmalate/(R)-2-methylmalate dehydratase large subunit
MGLTLYEKIWHAHKVLDGDDGQSLLHVARHLVHDGSVHAFQFLKEKGLSVRRSDQVAATPDHGISTHSHVMAAITDPEQRRVVERLVENTQAHGILHFPLGDPRQGIVHVVGPEQGLTQPGMVLVCGDSHTSTHGALGALAFGAGASEITHVLATQSTWQRRSKTLRVRVEGERGAHVSAKDVILAIIAKIGSNGAAGHVIEYAGSVIRAMSIEERLTVCNMSIEAGARAGMVAPDDTTFAYLQGRAYAPKGAMWEQALDHWRTLPSDLDARFDVDIQLDASALAPMVTWGNSPQDGLPITACVPNPKTSPTAKSAPAWSAHWPTWACKLAWRCKTLRSIRCSLARAPMAASKTCALRPRWPAWDRPRCRCWFRRDRPGSSSRPSVRAWTKFSNRPGSSGANRAARCAWA